MFIRIVAVIFIVLSLFSCRKEQNTIVQFCPRDFEPEAQILIGQALDKAVTNDDSFYKILPRSNHPAAYTYLDRLLETVVNTAPVSPLLETYQWRASIIENDTIEALFFVPGGHLYATTGMLKTIATEHQMIGLLAHELFYVTTDWIPQTIKEEELVSCFSLGDLTVGNELPDDAATIANTLPFISFPEEAVYQADSFAIELICPFLYEPLGLIDYLDDMATQNQSNEWIETRNANIEKRRQRAYGLAVGCDPGGVVNEENYLNFKALLP